MKHGNTLAKFVLVAAIAGSIYGCKKDDTTSPNLSLVGDDVTLNIGEAYVDPGYSANDDNDGDITSRVNVTDDIDVDSAGTYTVNYSVSDDAGNNATASRTVIVQNTLEPTGYKGVFNVTEACPAPGSYKDTVTYSNTVNNRIWFTRFANYTNGRVYATVNAVGGTVTVPAQDVMCGNPAALRHFTGNGTISTAGGVTSMSLNITELTNGTTVNCTENYTK